MKSKHIFNCLHVYIQAHIQSISSSQNLNILPNLKPMHMSFHVLQVTSRKIPDIPDELCKAAVLFIIIYIKRRERVCTNTSTRSIMTKVNFRADPRYSNMCIYCKANNSASVKVNIGYWVTRVAKQTVPHEERTDRIDV